MINVYINSGDGSTTGYYAVPKWTANMVATTSANAGRGSYCRQTAPAINAERVFRCTAITTGSGGSTEPTWNTAVNVSTADNGITWTECTGQEADQVSGSWNAPHARLSNALVSGWSMAGDNFYIADNSAESAPVLANIIFPGTALAPNTLTCVDRNCSIPPVSANIKTVPTASLRYTNNTTVVTGISGFVKITGISIIYGSTTYLSFAFGLSAHSNLFFKNCSFILSNNASLLIGSGNYTCKLVWDNTTYATGTGSVQLLTGDFTWKNSPSAVPVTFLANGAPLFIYSYSAQPFRLMLENVDLSGIPSGRTVFGSMIGAQKYFLKDCKLPNGIVIGLTPQFPGGEVYNLRSDSSGTNYRNEKYTYNGTETIDTAVTRTGGANNGNVSYSTRILTNTYSSRDYPFDALMVAIHNGVIGANVDIKMEGIWNAATLPLNTDVWLDLVYSGNTTSPIGTSISGTVTDFLTAGTALSASTTAWGGGASNYVPDTVYTTSSICKLASNPGRVFFCTAAGTSDSSSNNSPTLASFATAVDGDVVTEIGAVRWRAGVRFSMSVTLTSPQPALPGYVYAYPKIAKASQQVWLCPKLIVS